MRKFKLAFVAVARNPIPPSYGNVDGIAIISAILAEKLKARGHDITFICTKDSKINLNKIQGDFISFNEYFGKEYISQLAPTTRAELLEPFNGELHLLLLDEVKRNNFDLIHFNTSPVIFSLPFSRKINIPKIFTLHDQFSPPYNKIFDFYKDVKSNFFVSISKDQRKHTSELNYIENIYHGINADLFKFNEAADDYLFFSGRFHPVKGLDVAIQIAKTLKKKLFFSGSISYSHIDYFDKIVKPQIDNSQINYQNIKVQKELIPLYSRAKLFLFPISWEEPFGLVIIESMATGTPVVAFARGAVPEIVKDGETGFLINPSDDDIRGDFIIKKTGIEGMCEAVERIYSMLEDQYKAMRKACREHVEKNFTVERMVDEYEKVYEKILSSKA